MSKPTHKIVFRGTHAEIVERPLPTPAEGQILIEATCSLISPGTERAALTRVWDDAEFRQNPGYALAGRVGACGPGVSDLAVGQRVIAMAPHGSHVLASAVPWVTLPIPDGVSDEQATFLPLASVALHAMRRLEIQIGETFAIIGMGILGQLAISLGRQQGARRIIAVDLDEGRLEQARARGADQTINAAVDETAEQVMALTGGRGVPAILEATGNTAVIPQTFALAARGGRIALLGIVDQEVPLTFAPSFMQKELTLLAASQPQCPVAETIYWPWTQQANRRLLLEMMATGELVVDDLLTHRFPAGRAPQVYEQIKARDYEMLGVLLEWQ